MQIWVKQDGNDVFGIARLCGIAVDYCPRTREYIVRDDLGTISFRDDFYGTISGYVFGKFAEQIGVEMPTPCVDRFPHSLNKEMRAKGLCKAALTLPETMSHLRHLVSNNIYDTKVLRYALLGGEMGSARPVHPNAHLRVKVAGPTFTLAPPRRELLEVRSKRTFAVKAFMEGFKCKHVKAWPELASKMIREGHPGALFDGKLSDEDKRLLRKLKGSFGPVLFNSPLEAMAKLTAEAVSRGVDSP